MPRLNTKQIAQRLKTIPDWKKRKQLISRTYVFEGFPDSIKFVDRVAKKAEAMNHHPDLDIRWNQVTFTLTTHDEKGLTENDFALAEKCDQIAAGF